MTLPKRFVLLENGALWQEEFHMKVSWDACEMAAEQLSIPRYVEEQASEIKSEYIQMIYEIGRTQIEGKSLTEHLELFDNLSLWWLTTIVEKTPFIYESVYKVFKLRVFEKLYLQESCEELVYCGSDHQLNKVLTAWCQKIGHPYKHVPSNLEIKKDASYTLRAFFDKLPGIMQVFGWLLRRWWFRFRHSESLSNSTDKFSGQAETVVTFFPNIDLKKADHGKFHSRYWEKLHELLDSSEKKINWVWFFFETKDISFRRAVTLKNTFNQSSGGRQQFFLLEDFLDFRSIFKCLFLYCKVFLRGLRLRKIQDAFSFPGSKMNYFPILKEDWNSSIFGIMAIERIFQAVMFDSMAQHLPIHRWGGYTWENQPWELALVSAWRRHNEKIQIIAYEHSSVRPLDLRLFMAPEIYEDSSCLAFPVPDILGINGSAGISTMRDSGYPSEKLVRIEALRFFSLKGKYGLERKPMKEKERTLLVVTSIISREANSQLKFLHEAFHQDGLKKYEKVLIKPHPGLDLGFILGNIKPEFNYDLIFGNISDYWNEVDVAYCANSTGASLEAAWLGIPVIITSAIDSMNLNPLFGFKDVEFIEKTSRLIEALEKPDMIEIPDDYFFLDEGLESWKKILEL